MTAAWAIEQAKSLGYILEEEVARAMETVFHAVAPNFASSLRGIYHVFHVFHVFGSVSSFYVVYAGIFAAPLCCFGLRGRRFIAGAVSIVVLAVVFDSVGRSFDGFNYLGMFVSLTLTVVVCAGLREPLLQRLWHRLAAFHPARR